MHIPPGFNTVTPYVFIEDAAGFMEFLVRGLGGVELLRHIDNGRITNGQIRLGTSTIMVSEASAVFPAMPASYYLYVESADEAMTRAIAAGAVKVMDVANMPYNDRQGGVRDPFGNVWWLSQRLIAEPTEPLNSNVRTHMKRSATLILLAFVSLAHAARIKTNRSRHARSWRIN